MKFKKAKYRIADRTVGSREVTGYAVLTNYPVRFAVREMILDGMLWCADHWDTGFRFAYGHSRAEAAKQLEAPLFHSAEIAHFVYTDDEPQYTGRNRGADKFVLTRDNWHLMRAWP